MLNILFNNFSQKKLSNFSKHLVNFRILVKLSSTNTSKPLTSKIILKHKNVRVYSHTLSACYWTYRVLITIFFFYKNFYFIFMNKNYVIHYILLCHIQYHKLYQFKAHLVIPFGRTLHNTETSQMIWNTYKLTDLCMIRVPNEMYFLTEYNNTSITQ